MRWFVKLFGAAFLLAAGTIAYGFYYYDASGPLSEEKTVLFKRGMGFEAIVDKMAEEGVIRSPLFFKAIAALNGDARKFKAGEYDFSATITPKLVMDMIAAGRVVVHKVTVPEGLCVREIKELLAKEPLLEGDLPASIEEGSLLPETYHFTYGDERSTLISRMQSGMKQTLAELWAGRKEGLPFKTQNEALTLASIVEKETGLKEERGKVAAVFINRLRMGMKLQTDPTVAYGLEKQKNAPLGHALTLADLQTPTPYNTYLIDGLPPTPIASPGRASLEAVLNPPDTKDIYFVATGTGGHNFAATLAEHNANVAAYRAKMREQKAN